MIEPLVSPAAAPAYGGSFGDGLSAQNRLTWSPSETGDAASASRPETRRASLITEEQDQGSRNHDDDPIECAGPQSLSAVSQDQLASGVGGRSRRNELRLRRRIGIGVRTCWLL